MDGQTPHSRQDLHAQLDDLLDCAELNGGQLAPSQLFFLALNIAYGRGVAEHYHQLGVEEAERLHKSPVETDVEYDDRCNRVYTLNILARLLQDINCLPHDHEELRGRTAGGILPASFALSPLLLDCVSALADAGQTDAEGEALSSNSPLIFQIETRANKPLSRRARAAVVQAVYYQAEYRNITVTESLSDLDPELSEPTLRRWLKEVGGAKGALVTEAKRAGRDGALGADWMLAFDTDKFQRLYAIARGKNPKTLKA